MPTAAVMPMKWAKIATDGAQDRCACCGKVIKGKRRYVEVINGGADVAAPGLGPDESDAGYMGFFPVGMSCAKNHFPGFSHPE